MENFSIKVTEVRRSGDKVIVKIDASFEASREVTVEALSAVLCKHPKYRDIFAEAICRSLQPHPLNSYIIADIGSN